MAARPSADGAPHHQKELSLLFVVGQFMREEKARGAAGALASALINMPSDFRILRDLSFAPDIATELGHMCVAWAALEWRMFALYGLMSGTPHAIARATFYSHHNSSNRAVLVQHTAAMVLRGSSELDTVRTELSRLLLRIHHATKRRNAYIHDPWAADPTNSTPTISQFRLSETDAHGEVARINRNDVSQFTDKIIAWTDTLRDFDARISSLLPTSLGTPDRIRSVALAFHPTADVEVGDHRTG
jgi:hypothetical protein